MKRERLFGLMLFALLALATIVALEVGATILLRYMDQGTDPVTGGPAPVSPVPVAPA